MEYNDLSKHPLFKILNGRTTLLLFVVTISFVYLFVCHVQFPAQGAEFLLQFPNVQDKRALYKGAASRNFVLSEPQLHMTDEQIDNFVLRRLTRSKYNYELCFVFIYFLLNRYVYFLHNKPDKRSLVAWKFPFITKQLVLGNMPIVSVL